MKIITIFLISLLVSGCGDASKIEKAKKAVNFKLVDGITAKYSNVAVKKLFDIEVVCGYVNSKNIMGNYVGNKRFIYLIDEEQLILEVKERGTQEWAMFESSWNIDCTQDYLIK